MIVDNENVVQSEILFSHKERGNYEIKCMNVKYTELGENPTDWGKSGQEGQVPHCLSNRNPKFRSLVFCGFHGISVETGYPILGFYCCDKNSTTQCNMKRKSIYFRLLFQITVHHLKRSGQELKNRMYMKARTGAKAMEECCLLAGT